MWLKAHWEVRLAAVHVEAQREEARYTVLGALSRSSAAPTTTLGPLSTPKATENIGPFVRMVFVWVCGLKHPGNPKLRFKPRFSRFLNGLAPGESFVNDNMELKTWRDIEENNSTGLGT